MEKKYNLHLTQQEMDQLIYGLVLLKIDAINCLESKIGNLEKNRIQLATACCLLRMCAKLEAKEMKKNDR